MLSAIVTNLTYTVALTCDADDPLADYPLPNAIPEVAFTLGQNADVVVGQTATVNFSP